MMENLNAVIDRQQRLIQVGVFGTAALVGFAESRGDRTVAIIVYLLVPVAAATVAALWQREVDRLADATVANDAATSFGVDADPWKKELERARRFSETVTIGVFASTLLSGFLIWREIRGIEPGLYTYEWRIWSIVAALWVIISATVWISAGRIIFGALRTRFRQR